MAAALETLTDIQSEYFALIESSSLVIQCKLVDDHHLSIPNRLLSPEGQIILATAHGWKPAAFQEVERLFDSVYQFWRNHSDAISQSLQSLESRHPLCQHK